MLEELTIKNIALIDEMHIEFNSGFNVLSGETGAGKSILVGALGLLLGNKAEAGLIRQGADEASVSGVICPSVTEEVKAWMEQYGVKLDDGRLIIRRLIKKNGRGSVYIQSEPLVLKALQELMAMLFDMHSQHEHQSLFSIANHRKLLDRFGGLTDQVEEFSGLFQEWNDSRTELLELEKEESDFEEEERQLKKSIEEINKADLQEDEDESLSERQKLMAESEKLTMMVNHIVSKTAENKRGALAVLRELYDPLQETADFDPQIEPLRQRFDAAFLELEDIVESLSSYSDSLQFNPEDFQMVEDRLALITKLEKKYGPTIPDVLKKEKEFQERLQFLETREESLQEKREKLTALENQIKTEAAVISEKRRKIAEVMKKEVLNVLTNLGMKNADFKVDISRRKDRNGNSSCSSSGMDRVEFLLSANKGESMKPLRQVASGGEISRVMLAMKTVLAEVDTVNSLVFDEIDSGIGGAVGRKVGEYLKEISSYKQIFSITHLASIAVFADNHFKVEKELQDNRTKTVLKTVSGQDRIKEIARMLSGDSEGEASLTHAEELLLEAGHKVNC